MTLCGLYGLIKAEVSDWSPAWVAAGVALVAPYDGFARIVSDSASPDSELDKAALEVLKRIRWFLALCGFAFSVGVAGDSICRAWVRAHSCRMCVVLVVSSCRIAAGVSLRQEHQPNAQGLPP